MLAIIGFLLMLGSGANGSENIWLMILQFVMGLALLAPWFINVIKEEVKE